MKGSEKVVSKHYLNEKDKQKFIQIKDNLSRIEVYLKAKNVEGGFRNFVRYVDDSYNELEEIAETGYYGSDTKDPNIKEIVHHKKDIPEKTEYIEFNQAYGDNVYLELEVKVYFDNASPIIEVDEKYGCDFKHSVVIITKDKTSKINSRKYVITNTLNKPSSYNSFNQDLKKVKISGKEGIYYLHLRAKDKLGNETYRIFGPYVVK